MMNSFQARGERGSVMIVTLVVVFVMLILSGGFLALIINENSLTKRLANDTIAMNIAEAGVEAAIWELNYSQGDFTAAEGWSGAEPKVRTITLNSSSGTVWGEAQISVFNSSSNSPDIKVKGYIPSQASAQGGRTVKVILARSSVSLFNNALFGTMGIFLEGLVNIDSYNSNFGAYGGSNIGTSGNVATDAVTDGAIHIGNYDIVQGDALIGPGGDVNSAIYLGNSAYVRNKQPASSYVNPQIIYAPAGLPARSSLSLGQGDVVVINASGKYDTIDLSKNAKIYIDADADIQVRNKFEVGNTSQIIIRNGAKVRFFLDGAFLKSPVSYIHNESQIPAKLGFYGNPVQTQQNSGINYQQAGSFWGTFYFPNIDFHYGCASKVQSTTTLCDFYGAVVAKSIYQIDVNSFIHFDQALQSSTGGNGNSNFNVSLWQEK